MQNEFQSRMRFQAWYFVHIKQIFHTTSLGSFHFVKTQSFFESPQIIAKLLKQIDSISFYAERV